MIKRFFEKLLIENLIFLAEILNYYTEKDSQVYGDDRGLI